MSEHKNLYGSPPTGLYFNKALSLLHKELGDDGYDLGLPHCWYRWGDEVVRARIPSQVMWDHDVKTHVGWAGSAPARPTDELGEAMAERLDEILKDFSAQDHIEDMVDRVYAYAPFEFQRAYRSVRHAIYDAGQSPLGLDAVAQVLDGLIREALEKFPREDFPDVAYYADCAFTAATTTLRQDASQLALVAEALEKFWEFWCYHLRLHDQGHENVPDTTLAVWNEELGPQEQEYRIVFRSHLRAMLASAPALRDDGLFRPWLAKLDHTDEQADASMERWSQVLDGVDDFVQSEKAGYAE